MEQADPIALSSLDDQGLLRRASARDQQPWEVLVRRHAGLVNGVAVRYGLEEAAQAAVFQEVWEELWERRNTTGTEGDLSAWLVRSAARKSWQKLSQRLGIGQPARDPAASLPQRLIAEERWAALATAVEQLAPPCRVLLKALFFDPQRPSQARVALRRGATTPSVEKATADCLKRLREIIEENA